MGERLALPDVTLVAVSSVRMRRTIAAMRLSMGAIDFGAVRLFTHARPPRTDRRIKTVLIDRLDSIDAYNRFMVFDLGNHVETTHCLVVQADGYVLNPAGWRPDFLDYDYIGAPWPYAEDAYIDPFGNHQRVGNGGFSLRSRRLLTVPQRSLVQFDVNGDDFYRHMDAGLLSEDGCICVHNRHVYEANGCVFAPIEVAASFSRELPVPDVSGTMPFGFHKYHPVRRRMRRAPWLRGWS